MQLCSSLSGLSLESFIWSERLCVAQIPYCPLLRLCLSWDARFLEQANRKPASAVFQNSLKGQSSKRVEEARCHLRAWSLADRHRSALSGGDRWPSMDDRRRLKGESPEDLGEGNGCLPACWRWADRSVITCGPLGVYTSRSWCYGRVSVHWP